MRRWWFRTQACMGWPVAKTLEAAIKVARRVRHRAQSVARGWAFAMHYGRPRR